MILDVGQSKWVNIREDNLKIIRALEEQLNMHDISNNVNLSPRCANGSCSLTYVLAVPESHANAGLSIIEQYFMKVHPELKKAKELEDQGRCPACGFDNGHDAMVCKDCGLLLIMEV